MAFLLVKLRKNVKKCYVLLMVVNNNVKKFCTNVKITSFLLLFLHNKRRGHWANSTKMGYVVLLTFLSKSGIITEVLGELSLF